MKKSAFVSYCLILTFVILQAHFYVRSRFTGVDDLRARVGQMRGAVEREKLRTELAQQQLSEYRQYVATLMPDALREERDEQSAYRLRTLASVVVAPSGDHLPLERAAGLFERSKKQFRDGEFEKANVGFRRVVSEFPQSVHVPEAHFLLSEGLFQLKEYEACLEVVESMITLFPESELTGFALLRLGKVYEYQDRFEDAVEIYRTVLASYADQPLLTQARLSLKAVEL